MQSCLRKLEYQQLRATASGGYRKRFARAKVNHSRTFQQLILDVQATPGEDIEATRISPRVVAFFPRSPSGQSDEPSG